MIWAPVRCPSGMCVPTAAYIGGQRYQVKPHRLVRLAVLVITKFGMDVMNSIVNNMFDRLAQGGGVAWRCEVGLVWIVRLLLLVRECSVRSGWCG